MEVATRRIWGQWLIPTFFRV